MINFTSLQSTLRTLDHHFKIEAGKSVNRLLTIRNWLFGFYVFEFQQRGADRAAYGERLLEKLAESMRQKSFSYRNLRLYRQFYLTYPHLASSIGKILETNSIWQSLIAKLQAVDSQAVEIVQSLTAQFNPENAQAAGNWQTLSAKLNTEISQTLSGLLQKPENQGEGIGQTMSAQSSRQIGQTVSDQFEISENQLPPFGQSLIAQSTASIGQSLIGQFQSIENQTDGIAQTSSAQFGLPPEKLLSHLSFTHFSLLLTCEKPLQRAFYEIESIRGGWSVRELKRQIETLLFERTGLSNNKEELLRRTHQQAEPSRRCATPSAVWTSNFLSASTNFCCPTRLFYRRLSSGSGICSLERSQC